LYFQQPITVADLLQSVQTLDLKEQFKKLTCVHAEWYDKRAKCSVRDLNRMSLLWLYIVTAEYELQNGSLENMKWRCSKEETCDVPLNAELK